MAPSDPPLSFSAEQLLHALVRRVTPGPQGATSAREWLAALLEQEPGLLAGSGVTVEDARALAAAPPPSPTGLTVAEVTERAAARAAESGHAVTKPEDLAGAIADAAGGPPEEPAEGSVPPVEVQRSIPPSAEPASGGPGSPVPLSFGAEQLVTALTSRVGAGTDRTPGAYDWVVALVALDAALVERVTGHPASHLDTAAHADMVAASGDHGAPLARDELVRRAGVLAGSAGRPLASSEDVAGVVLESVEVRVPPSTREAEGAVSDEQPPDHAAVPPPATVGPTPTRTFRVFVSSTFDDLSAERDVLQRRVFPELRALCRDRGARFQAIDLRWGVGEEASRDQQTMNVCLSEIDRCHEVTPRPNFVVLLGQHYGWRPLPPQVDANEFDAIAARVRSTSDADARRLEQWYELDENAVPPERRLRARTGDYVDNAAWLEEEADLRRIIGAALPDVDLSPDDRRKYEASATEQEIDAGALTVTDPGEKVVCFFRTIEGTPPASAPVGRFVDADQGPIERLRGSLERCLPPECIVRVPSRWIGDAPKTDLDALRDRALDLLRRSIQRELDEPSGHAEVDAEAAPELLDHDLDEEGRAHRAFGRERSRFFVGRDDALQAIAHHLDQPGGRSFAVVAGGGTGKSALLARAVHDIVRTRPRAELVVRFIGSTAASSDVRTLLVGLCRELGRRYGTPESSVPADFRELVADFRDRLGTATADRPLVLVLDALDQLSSTNDARALFWLPMPLPEHVHLVVSTRPGDTEKALERLVPAGDRFVLGAMSRDDGDALLALWLGAVHRTLQPAQRTAVLDAFEAADGNPLYLRLAFEQARRWSSATPAPTLPSGVDGVTGIVSRLVDELEHAHGALLVARTLGYLAVARHGLTEDELLDVLSRDVDLYEWFFTSAYHVPPDLAEHARDHLTARGDQSEPEAWLGALRAGDREPRREFLGEALMRPDGPRLPVVLWSRLAFDLQPYLTERLGEDGSSLLTFFHLEVGDVARARYLVPDARDEFLAAGPDLHSRLADYFAAKADPIDARAWDAYPRGLAELPYHLTEAERWDDLTATLTDFTFLERKATDVGSVRQRDAHGEERVTYTGVFLLQDDFDHALERMPDGDRGSGRRPIIVTAVDFGEGPVIRCPFCNRSTPLRNEWLEGGGAQITCPQEGCDGPLKVNPFVAGRASG